ncbi:serine hydrolase [Embleya sp. NPDC005575]|uniref:serine hydrolase n=1 Tax=Embleya sp. NPDC005575 TaxID=3156892 RepID=UPI0033B94090
MSAGLRDGLGVSASWVQHTPSRGRWVRPLAGPGVTTGTHAAPPAPSPTDRATPAAACARVRAVMARQVTRHRIAGGFRPPVRVAAKSGSLVGVIRNEIGVISYPDGRRYAAAVFTRSRPGSDDFAISGAIGTATAQAVAALRNTGV